MELLLKNIGEEKRNELTDDVSSGLPTRSKIFQKNHFCLAEALRSNQSEQNLFVSGDDLPGRKGYKSDAQCIERCSLRVNEGCR